VDGKVRIIFLKGAPEIVVDFCSLSENSKTSWLTQAAHMGERGMRVLACAYQLLPPEGSLVVEVAHRLKDLTMSCVLGFHDPIREEVCNAVEIAHLAGITVKMITGDHPLTAMTIGESLKIQDGTHNIVTGTDLDSLIMINDLTTFDHIVRNNNIFARTLPSHKLLIVQSLQRQNLTCCMTGNGVNDAPALLQANVGVAMGLTGSNVAKEASHIIITDNNFITIIEAIKYGRCTYENLMKILIFTLPINVAQPACIIVSLILDLKVPFIDLQILWINMVPAIFLGLVLAFEKPEPNLMMRPPRPREKSIFDQFLIWRIIFVSTLLVVCVLGNIQWRRSVHDDDGDDDVKILRTVAINTLIVGQTFYLFNCRYPRDNVHPWKLLRGNSVLFFGIGGVILFQSLFTYSKYFQYAFETKSLDAWAWLQMVVLGFFLFLLIEIEKGFVHLWKKWFPGNNRARIVNSFVNNS
jgi:magnesium-transporting ATPase (P-type)